jgi:hypothetical protein
LVQTLEDKMTNQIGAISVSMQGTYKRFSQRSETRRIDPVFAQVEHLEVSIPLQDLSDIVDTALAEMGY